MPSQSIPWAEIGIDYVGESGIDANNIIRFERVTVAA